MPSHGIQAMGQHCLASVKGQLPSCQQLPHRVKVTSVTIDEPGIFNPWGSKIRSASRAALKVYLVVPFTCAEKISETHRRISLMTPQSSSFLSIHSRLALLRCSTLRGSVLTCLSPDQSFRVEKIALSAAGCTARPIHCAAHATGSGMKHAVLVLMLGGVPNLS